jgi:imidazole glycerol-phosphate synthase subunit HisH
VNRPSVTVVDYGVGNLYSVAHALEHCGARVVLAADAYTIEAADRLLLPGVGAFADGMASLQNRGLVDAIRRFAQTQRPLLGICLGMQMLASQSEEFGSHAGLDLIPGHVRPIPATTVDGRSQKIPHVGWSGLRPPAGASWTGSVLRDTTPDTAVYLVHSFHVVLDDPAHLLAHFVYGGHDIAAAIQSQNITGCQFHPEKSGRAGLHMLSTFVGRSAD